MDVKVLAENLSGIKRLQPTVGSLALIIPRAWARFHCVQIDGNYFVRVKAMGASLVFTAIDDEKELENIGRER